MISIYNHYYPCINENLIKIRVKTVKNINVTISLY